MPKTYTQRNTVKRTDVQFYASGGYQPGYPVDRFLEIGSRKFTNVVTTNNKNNGRPWSPYRYEMCETFGGVRETRMYAQELVSPGSGQPSYWRTYYRGKLHSSAYFLVNDTIPFPDSSFADVDDIALAKFLSSLQEERTQWQAAVALGEARETASHIAKCGTRLYRGFLAFKKGRVMDAYGHLVGRHVDIRHERVIRNLRRKAGTGAWVDDVSSAWMEFSFAWVPLLSDIDSAARYLAEKRFKTTQPCTRVSRKHFREAKLPFTKVLVGTDGEIRVNRTESRSVRYTAELAPKWLRNPSTMAELGFTDPATVVWNLLPLSFVVDYFVNVGQVLESLHEFSQWTCLRGMKMSRNVLWRDAYIAKQPTGRTNSGSRFTTYVWGGLQAQRKQWVRRDLWSPPTSVPLRIKVSNPFDLKSGQLATVAVLLRYAFR